MLEFWSLVSIHHAFEVESMHSGGDYSLPMSGPRRLSLPSTVPLGQCGRDRGAVILGVLDRPERDPVLRGHLAYAL
jgi:hypothetical protein